MLISCPECNSNISNTAAACPHCGHPMTPAPGAPAPPKSPGTPLLLILSALGLFLCLFTPRILLFLPLMVTAALAVVSMVRKERFRWAGFVVLAGCLGLLVLEETSSPGSNAGKEVIYKVSGSGGQASVTYQNAGGGTEQAEVALPWSQTITAPSGGFVYISAQNKGAYGSVTCEIDLDGKVYKTSISTGEYGIATCSG